MDPIVTEVVASAPVDAVDYTAFMDALTRLGDIGLAIHCVLGFLAALILFPLLYRAHATNSLYVAGVECGCRGVLFVFCCFTLG